MTQERLRELEDMRKREARLSQLLKHFDQIALKKERPEIAKFCDQEEEIRLESVFRAADHLSLGAWVRIGSIIRSEFENARDEFAKAS